MKHPSFTTIATMTAGDPADLTQVAIVRYYYNQVAWKNSTIVDSNGTGEGKPFYEVAGDLHRPLHEQIVVSYGPAAKESIEAAFKKTGLECPTARWLDCQEVVPRIWSKRCGKDCTLTEVSGMIRHRYQPGSALEDAKAIGAVFIEVIAESGLSAEGWELVMKMKISRRGE